MNLRKLGACLSPSVLLFRLCFCSCRQRHMQRLAWSSGYLCFVSEALPDGRYTQATGRHYWHSTQSARI